jgi:cyclopropane fatty-acyl-phospholipid synthase-like methyltransferase
MAEADDKQKFVEHPDDIYRSGAYLEQNPSYHVEDSAWKAGEIVKMIEKHAVEPHSVCEVGCGAGEVLRQLQLKLPPDTMFFGYEISPQAFALCQTRENERLQFYCSDLLANKTAQFDLLLCIDVFEHVENYLGFLRELRGKATRTIFHIPLDLSAQWVSRRGPIMRERKQGGHLHYFTKETALATLEDCGYEVRDWCYTAGAIANPRSVKAKLASWPRRLLSKVNQDLVVRVLGGYSLLVLAE